MTGRNTGGDLTRYGTCSTLIEPSLKVNHFTVGGFLSSHCFAAWKHLSVKSANRAAVCCAWNRDFEVSDWDTVESHPELLAFRAEMLSRSWPGECVACQSKASKGMTSRKDLLNGDVTHDFSVGIEVLEVNLSNLCNYACVMCNSEYSTRWKALEPQIFSPGPLKARPPRDSFRVDEPTLDKLVSLVRRNPVRRIELQGGEPLLLSETFYFLRALEAASFRGEIWIVTNGSIVSEEFLQFAGGGLRIFVTVSLDTIDEKLYRLIRSPEIAVATIIKNVDTLKQKFGGVFLSAAISNLNAYQYNEMDQFSLATSGRRLSVNWVQRPPQLQLFRLNQAQRRRSLEILASSSHQGPMAQKIGSVLKNNSATPRQLNETRAYLEKFCLIKGLSLADSWLLYPLADEYSASEVEA